MLVASTSLIVVINRALVLSCLRRPWVFLMPQDFLRRLSQTMLGWPWPLLGLLLPLIVLILVAGFNNFWKALQGLIRWYNYILLVRLLRRRYRTLESVWERWIQRKALNVRITKLSRPRNRWSEEYAAAIPTWRSVFFTNFIQRWPIKLAAQIVIVFLCQARRKGLNHVDLNLFHWVFFSFFCGKVVR